MSSLVAGLGLVWTLAATPFGWPCPREADLDGDGRVDRVRLSLDVAGVQTAKGLLSLPLAPPAVRAICLAELDGQAGVEVLAVAKVAATKDRRLGLRLFVYRVDGGELRPGFLGTRGGGDLLGVGLADLDGDGRAEVLARERDEGRQVERDLLAPVLGRLVDDWHARVQELERRLSAKGVTQAPVTLLPRA